MSFRIGVDVGGTFTDFLLLDSDGTASVYKVSSTPDDPSRAVLDGLTRMAGDVAANLKGFIADIDLIVHGTTVTTNAVLTGKTSPTGLLTTRGFRDALQMRRGVREVQYDNKYPAAKPLVPRWLRRPVSERVDAQGAVVHPLELADVDDAINRFKAVDIEAVAICFMHGYANSDHEQATADRVTELMPQAYLSVSSQVLPQVRFYERISTTVLNAAVGPILSRYLTNLTARLTDQAFTGVLLIMQSNGGVTSPGVAAELAASTLLSGPAAAPVAGLAYAKPHATEDFITIDMGGTSFDAALVKDGAPAITTDSRVNRHALGLASMEINTIGAGGGSIAWINEGGLLRMGPDSAGASPGPVCYGRGGIAPTCSDADLVLGYLDADFFAGGTIALDRPAAEQAIAEQIATPLGMTTIDAAYGMYHLMNVNMASAIREISVQKGYDPRDFLLICAGGAGPIHAAAIAVELEIRRILIPKESSIFCAAGMLHSDLKHDFVRSYHTPIAASAIDASRFNALIDEMRKAGDAVLAAEGVATANRTAVFSVDLRYLGQYHEVNVAVPAAQLTPPDFEAIASAFHAAHDRLYGYSLADDDRQVNLVNIRMTAIGKTEKPELRDDIPGTSVDAAHKGQRAVFLPSQMAFATVDVYDGDAMGSGHALDGPAVIEQRNTTILVPPDHHLACDALGSFLLSVS